MGDKKIWNKPKHLTSIGGEALIEGVMMRGPESIASAIRKADGEIVIDKKAYMPLSKKYSLIKLPIVRGAVGMIESMVVGMKALMHSAELVEIEEEEEESKFEKFLQRIFGDKMQDILIFISVSIALVFGIGLFVILPNLVATLLHFDETTRNGNILYNLIEGVLRVVLFFGYIILISNLKDIKRVFEYHGAEHKTIHCYESDEELIVENVKKHTRRHPRCGTAFLFVVMIISILVFSFIGQHGMLLNIVFRLCLLPLVAGISYEIIKFAGRSDSKIMRIVSMPGLFLQNFTTREPDDSQMEVAIEALKAVIVDDREADKW